MSDSKESQAQCSNCAEHTISGLRKDALAKLLAPSSVGRWHAKKQEIKIGQNTFIGFPVACHSYPGAGQYEGGETNDSKRRNEVKTPYSTESSQTHGSCSPVEQAVHGTSDVDRREPSTDGHAESDKGSHQIHLSGNDISVGAATDPVPTATQVPIENRPDQTHDAYSSFADQPSQSFQSTVSSTSITSEGEQRGNPLNLFNIVLVTSLPEWQHHDQVQLFVDHIVKPFTLWLLRAQRGSRWVESQVRKADYMSQREQKEAAYSPNQTSISVAPGTAETVPRLENMLQDLVNGLNQGRVVHLSLETGRDVLSLRMPRPFSSPFIPQPLSGCSTSQYPVALSSSPLSLSSEVTLRESQKDSAAKGRRAGWRIDQSSLLDKYDRLGVETNEPLAVSRHSTLVLLGDRDVMLSQLQTGKRSSTLYLQFDLAPFHASPLAQPLVYFIKHLTFRRTLTQLTQPISLSQPSSMVKSEMLQTSLTPAMPGLALEDAQLLSCLLIRLGAAYPTSPLHASNTYIVNPVAPVDAFELHSRQWDEQFEEVAEHLRLPSLPQVLERLSTAAYQKERSNHTGSVEANNTRGVEAPRPWTQVIPEKGQKAMYMDMLAWLLARRWVVQIRTFAWVCVSADVKQQVKVEDIQAPTNGFGPANTHDDTSKSELDSTVGVESRTTARPRQSWLSPFKEVSRTPSVADSTGSTRTAVRAPLISASRKSSRDALSRASTPAPFDSDDLDQHPSLIASPHHATEKEQRWLSFIGEHLKDADAKQLWPELVTFFDGRHALEEIAAMQGLKRALLAGVFKRLIAENVLRTVRHW